MQKTTNKQYATALYDALVGVAENDQSVVIKNFVEIMAKSHKLKQANNIIAEYVKYAKAKEGIMDIEITTAQKADKKVIDEIKAIFGKKTESIEKIDKTILGGVKIRTEELIFDATIKTQIGKLKQLFN